MLLKRVFDMVASFIGLLILSPLFLVVALLIKFDSNGTVYFRQERVGRGGKFFKIHKFRTMISDADTKGLLITVGSDVRVTGIGRTLRKFKLDELPQLIDVLVGSMSLVGPRPEVPKYIEFYPEDIKREVLSVRPGITDRASIEFKDENIILANSPDPHKAYIEEVLPKKLKFYVEYVRERSFSGDMKIIFRTIFEIVRQR